MTLPMEATAQPTPETTTRVLFVCTANICRSPMAQRLLRARVGTRARIATASAGLLDAGQPAAPGTLRALERIGIDGSSHVSQMLTPALLASADLVIGMERRHVQEAALMAPDRFPRMFTIKELVRRGGQAGARRGESVEAWVRRVHGGRTPRDLLGADAADDVSDPYGGEEHDYEQTLRELDDLVVRLVDLLWPAPAVEGPA